jgi:hypothetical protein
MRLATSHPLVEELIGLSFILNTFAAVWVYTVLTPAALEATKVLVRLVLQREREGNLGAPAGLRQRLDAVPKEALLAAIRRHRLECLLHGDPIVASLLPELAATLQVLARQDAMAALALASLTREMAALFEQAAMPMLVIKGIPLALQTTGSLTSRGRGDLDLLVDPQRLPEAVALLESSAFRRLPGYLPRDLNSFWARYGRWAGYELSMVREGEGAPQWIDLHWALSNVRGPLPSFAVAWQCRELLEFSGQSVSTLSRAHAFQHACAHAAKDQWMCLRNLIDIDRLGRQLSSAALISLRREPTVRWSGAVTHIVAEAVYLKIFLQLDRRGMLNALQRARQAQLLPWRCEGIGPWTPGRWFSTVWRLLALSRSTQDWLRTLCYYILLPAAFVDPLTGEDRGIRGFVSARVGRLRNRLGERNSSNPTANASLLGADSKPKEVVARSN